MSSVAGLTLVVAQGRAAVQGHIPEAGESMSFLHG